MTAVAIVLGVAMVAGTFMLTDLDRQGVRLDLHGRSPGLERDRQREDRVRPQRRERQRLADPGRVDFIDFALPIGQLLVFAVAAIVVGLLAAIFPARRAARLNVLAALQYE